MNADKEIRFHRIGHSRAIIQIHPHIGITGHDHRSALCFQQITQFLANSQTHIGIGHAKHLTDSPRITAAMARVNDDHLAG